jgi:polar amino acid transport system substrate-binding protein
MKWLVALVLLCSSLMVVAAPLRFGFGTHKPPYVFEGEPRGLEYEIVTAAAANAGLHIEVLYAPMERLHLLLRRGKIDAITTTNENSGVRGFYSEPYIRYQNVAVALRKNGYKIERIADLAEHSLSAFQRARFLLGSEYAQMVERHPRYREEANQIARNRLLYSGRVDVVVGDIRILRYFNREVGDQVDVSQPLTIYPLFAPTPYSVGFLSASLRDRFDKGLATLHASGQYLAIERKYEIY